MLQDSVSYAFFENSGCIIQLKGAVKYTNVASVFEKFVDSLTENDSIDKVIIDMRYCTYIDSTDLGILARIAITQMKRNAAPPVIVHAEGSDIEKILSDVGFTRVFKLVTSIDIESADLMELPQGGIKSEMEMAKMLLRAHEELIELDDNNTDKFSVVVEQMKRCINTEGKDCPL